MARRTNISYRRKATEETFIIKNDATLLEYMMLMWPGKSRNEIKSYLTHRQIEINGKTETAYDLQLNTGDTLKWKSIGTKSVNPNCKLRIIYEDQDIILVDKKEGVLTLPTSTYKGQTVYDIIEKHVKRQDKSNRIFTVTRLERDASGLILFAKSERAQKILLANWEINKISTMFTGVIEGHIAQDKGQITSWLKEDLKSPKITASSFDNGGKKAITNFEIVKRNQKYSLAKIQTSTNYKHQIRSQFSSIGHPIAGDKRYGAKSNPIGRLCLHAQQMSFTHPSSHEIIKFDTGTPSSFK